MKGGDYSEVELASGERLLWTGHPPRGPLALSLRHLSSLPAVLMLAFILTVAFSTILTAVRGRGDPPLFVGAFLVILSSLLVVPTILSWYVRRRTRYFLTTHRALVVLRVFGKTAVSERTLTAAQVLMKKIRRNGSGTIWFDPGSFDHPIRFGPFGLGTCKFLRIQDAEHVVELIDTSTNFHVRPGELRRF